MEVICDHCKTKLNIPDDRIPKGQAVTTACPKCKEKLTLNAVEKPGEIRPSPMGSDSERELAGGARPYVLEDNDEALEYYDDGVRLALVMAEDTGRINAMKKALETLNFKWVEAESNRKAIGKMRLYHFDVAIFEEDFGGVPLEQSPVLHYLNHLSTPERRRMFVVIAGNNFRTLDRMTAFALSVNLVVNNKDMAELATILKRSMSENDKFYKVFIETLRETGKA